MGFFQSFITFNLVYALVIHIKNGLMFSLDLVSIEVCTSIKITENGTISYPTSKLLENITVLKNCWLENIIGLYAADVMWFCCTQSFQQSL